MALLNDFGTTTLRGLRKIEPVYQGEVSECGLACAAMLLQALGVDVTLAGLRERHGAPLLGMSLADLVDVLAEHGVEADPVNFDREALGELPLPAVLHVGGNHYVLVMRSAGQLFHVFDPAVGARLIHGGVLGGVASGYAVMLADSVTPRIDGARAGGPRSWWTRFVDGAGGPRLIGLMLATGALSFIAPLFVGMAIDRLLGQAGMHGYWATGAAFLLAVIGAFAFERYCGRVLLRRCANFATQSLDRGFRMLVENRLRYFSRRAPGDLVERFVAYGRLALERIRIGNAIVCAGVVTVVAMSAMAWLLPGLALVSMMGIAISGLITQRHARQMQGLRLEAEQAAAAQQQFLLETVQGITAWKSAPTMRRRIDAYLDHSHDVVRAWHRQSELGLRQRTAYMLLGNVELLLMLGVAASAMTSGQLTFGGFYAFAFLRQIAFSAATQGYDAWVSSRSLKVVEARAQDMFGYSRDTFRSAPGVLRDALRVEAVSFRHEGSPVALEQVDLEIRRGAKIAVLGESGSGKTTLLTLLSGLERPHAGRLEIDGMSVDDWASLRPHCYLQTAHDILFSGSVLDNVTMFAPQANKAACWHWIEALGLACRIRALPAGVDTHVSDATASLSAGERQRLLVARALYAGCSIGIFDEPTANLDAASAGLVMTAITAAPHAAVVVTHDRTHLDLFDTVYQLCDGKLHCVRMS